VKVYCSLPAFIHTWHFVLCLHSHTPYFYFASLTFFFILSSEE
jgi:hypothetical protein